MTGPVAGSRAKISVVPGEPRELLVSVFSTSDGAPLGKVCGLDSDGKLRKASRAWLTNGRVEQRRFTDLFSFLEAVDEMGSHQAMGFGVSEFESARVVTKERLRTGTLDGPVVARTKECFSFRQCAGIFQVDYDPRPGAAPLSPVDVVKLLRASVPELKGVTMCSKPSSSSHLSHPDGSSLVGSSGAHIFIPVQDASLIPNMGQTIVDRLWLAGSGWIKISGAGVLIDSTIIDQSVLSPERLCFVRAACEDGVSQNFPAFQIHPGTLDAILGGERWLDDLTPLTSAERVEVARLKSAARAAAQPEADRVRKIWAEQQADRRCAVAGAAGECQDRAALVQSFLQHDGLVLPRDLVLHPLNHQPVTAADVLSEPQKWNGVRFADPFEPEYGNDPRIAKAVMDQGEPYITSFAHGGLKYYFRSDEARTAALALEFADLRKRRRFEAVPAGEFICGAPPTWLVRGVMPKAALGVLYGPSGSGKSFLALDLAASIALGKSWNSLSTRQGDVVYICAEGAGGFGKRIQAYLAYHGVSFGTTLRVIGDQPDLLTRDDISDLLAELQRAKPALVIIDTLAQVMPGGDENSGIDIGHVLKACRQIHERVGAMVLLVHHAGKDLSKGARGWSGLRAAADVEISVLKGPMVNVATITKMKDGDDRAAYAFKLRPVQLPSYEDEPVSSCVVEHCEATTAATRAVEPKGANQRAIFRAARELASMGQGVLPADILSFAMKSIPFDPGPDPATPKRDNRRSNLNRALTQLCDIGALFLKEGLIFAYDPDASPASNASNEARD